jgi:hypothetical protein
MRIERVLKHLWWLQWTTFFFICQVDLDKNAKNPTDDELQKYLERLLVSSSRELGWTMERYFDEIACIIFIKTFTNLHFECVICENNELPVRPSMIFTQLWMIIKQTKSSDKSKRSRTSNLQPWEEISMSLWNGLSLKKKRLERTL